jgi:hypothetical protein
VGFSCLGLQANPAGQNFQYDLKNCQEFGKYDFSYFISYIKNQLSVCLCVRPSMCAAKKRSPCLGGDFLFYKSNIFILNKTSLKYQNE